MATIGYSYWGYLRPDNLGPDGTKYTRWQLLHELLLRGHDVVLLQPQRDRLEHSRLPLFQPDHAARWPAHSHWHLLCTRLRWEPTSLPPLDLLICEHRWPKFPNETAVLRQDALLAHYGEQGVPCLLWDQDHEVKRAYELRFPHAIILEPSERPLHYTRKRVSWHYSAVTPSVQVAESPTQELTYVGNNYQRDRMFATYVGEVAAQRPGAVHVYGNWRKRPKKLSYALDPDSPVCFHPNIPQSEVIPTYRQGLATVLITKASYAKTCLIPIRVWEAAHAGIVILTPQELRGSDGFTLAAWRVGSTRDMVEALETLRHMSLTARQAVADAQLALLAHRTPAHALDELNAVLQPHGVVL